jgi:hypothetical protein
MAVRDGEAPLSMTTPHVLATLGALCRVVSGNDLDPAGSVTFSIVNTRMTLPVLRGRVDALANQFGLLHRFQVEGDSATVRVWRRDLL